MTNLNYLNHTQVFASTDVGAANSLGETWWEGDAQYRLVQNNTSSALASAASKPLVTAFSAGVPTWKVTTTTTADSDAVAGVVPSDIATISTTSGQLDAGDIFAVQIRGPGSVLAENTTAIDGDILSTSTTAGQADELVDGTAAATLTTALSYQKAGFAVATNTAGVTAAGLAITCVINTYL